MHRTLGDGYVVDGGKRIYADEDIGIGRDATQVRHQEANSFQEEIASVIEAESFTLNPPTETLVQMTQLNTAIDKKVSDEADWRIAGDAAEAVARAGGDSALSGTISALTSDDIANGSSVVGVNTSDALDTLNAAISVQIPRGYIDGLQMVVPESSSLLDKYVDFYEGICKDKTDSLIIERSGSAMRKNITGAWTQGTNQNGFGGNDSGPLVGSWYYTFVLYKSGQPVDYGFDNDPTGVNLLSASTYTHCRRIGAVFYVATDKIRAFKQKGNRFYHFQDNVKETLELQTAAGGFLPGTLQCYPSQIDHDILSVYVSLSAPANNNGGAGVYAMIWPRTMSGTYAYVGNINEYDSKYDSAGNNVAMSPIWRDSPEASALSGEVMILSQQTLVPCSISYRCHGYIDLRGRDGV